MKRILAYVVPAIAAGVVAFAALGTACNDVGDCPTAAITPGAACSGDNLECPYTLASPDPACDGTMIDGGIATSCVCTDGTWACPEPIACDTGDGGGDETTPAVDAADETTTDAADDASTDASTE